MATTYSLSLVVGGRVETAERLAFSRRTSSWNVTDMTDPGSTPSHDIESLAARAKEMLERVQGATAPVSASEPSEPEVADAEEHSETSEIADTDATVRADLDEVAEAET